MLIFTCLSGVATFLLLEYLQEILCPLILLEFKHFGERHVHMVRHTIFPVVDVKLLPGNNQLRLLFFVHWNVFLFKVHVSIQITFKVCMRLRQMILFVDEDWSCQPLLFFHTLVSHGTANHFNRPLNLESSSLRHRLIHGLNIDNGCLLSWTQVVEEMF